MKKTERQARPARSAGSRRLPKEITTAIGAAQDKKGSELVVLDLRRSSAFTDYFLLCTGQNQRQVKALADAIEEMLRGLKLRPAHVEGYDRADWVLLDYFTFIVHIFTPATREFYGLERLWGQAERIAIDRPEGQAVEPPRRA
jgi:ribosome-associated protein